MTLFDKPAFVAASAFAGALAGVIVAEGVINSMGP